MQKLDKTFKINPLYEADSYKIGHKDMMADFTTKEYWTWIPRNLKYMPAGIDKIMSAGQQMVVRHLHSTFKEFFFDQSVDVAIKFGQDMCLHIGKEFNYQHFIDLHTLGYLPISIKALPEGVFTKANIPHMTGINTINGYAWLGLYLETYISKLAWQLPTAATIGDKFKSNAIEWVNKTDEKNLWLADFMCHDFHSRGGNPFTSISVGLGHAMSNYGSDTLNVIPASRYYYDVPENEMPIFSVTASEHSVSCTKIFTVGERQMIIDWLKKYPNGNLSMVADTFDLWYLITNYLSDPEIKELIMARNGKLVIRPDSGDPVDIICGISEDAQQDLSENTPYPPEYKGVIELLWDIFGGTVNEQGFKVLDSHIGAIYGDSINLERQIQIYKRLSNKWFAATNIILGVGSFTYVMLTRDSAGYAAKGAWFENFDENGAKKGINIYKDPATDDGTKKSLKGKVAVLVDELSGEYIVKEECTDDQESVGELRIIYENGRFYNQTDLAEIRLRIKQYNES